MNLTPGVPYTDTENNSPSNCFGNETLHNTTDDICYKVVLNTGGTVHISNVGTNFQCGIGFGTVTNGVQTNIGSSTQVKIAGGVTYAMDTLAMALQPGTYYIVTAGMNADIGNIVTNISLDVPRAGANMSTPINAGTLAPGSSYSDTENNSPSYHFFNDYGEPSDDIFYQFTLAGPAQVGILAAGFDTYLTLLDANGNQMDYNDDYGPLSTSLGQASLLENLSPGTYYIVSEGKGTNSGFVTTSITVSPPIPTIPINNYVITNTIRLAGITSKASADTTTINGKVQVAVYFDGLGRPMQQVDMQASPSKRDIVTQMIYDQFGRDATKYLPYAATVANSDGSFKTTAIADQASFYANPSGTSWNASGVDSTSKPYSQTLYEPTPLSRVIEQGYPGAAWQPAQSRTANGGRTSLISYSSNTDQNGVYKVRLYTATAPGSGQVRQLNCGGWYPADVLFLTITKDENWTSLSAKGGTVEEYKDKEGRIVLKRIWQDDNTSLSTYYVFDDLGNLSFVLTPASGADGAAGITSTGNQSTLDNFCYQYQYDGRNRLIKKKIPGKGWESLIYDRLDQVVMTQDAVQNSNNQWTVTKYDAMGRVIVTGLLNDTTAPPLTRDALQGNMYAAAQWDIRDGSNNTTANPTGYVITSYPALNSYLTINYYDNYTFPGNPYNAWATPPTNPLPTGLLTGTKTAVLKPDGTIGTMLWAAHYYDYLGRVVQTTKENYLSGAALTNNHDVIQNTYNFDNTLATTTRYHLVAAVQTLKIADTYYYDQVGRKTQTWEAITVGSNPSPPGTLLSRTDYNEIGQVTAKHLHQNSGGAFLQDINYAYNERGWLVRINNPSAVTATQVFGERLQYNTGATPQFNGNISGISWQTMVPAGLGLLQTQQSYTYNYDPLNRLTQASYSAPAAAGKFNEQLAYDYMGNITTLKRTNSTTAGVYLNNFTYNYTSGGVGNLLWSVTDAGTAAQNGSYTYDLNGNAASDTRNLVTNIKYNLLNLPATVTRTPGNMSYTYDAAGSKLEKVSGGITRDYVDGIEYNNGTVEFISTEEGRAIPSGSTYIYQYYLKDQLGNTRAAINQDGSIIQVQDYYAFGMEMNPGNSLISSPPNQYKYNGKETQPETGDIDYGARFYDPVIGRWTSVDPLAEVGRWESPYNYAFDDPMRFTDPDGMWPDGDCCGVVGAFATGFYNDIKGAVTGTLHAIAHPVETAKGIDKMVRMDPETIMNGSIALAKTVDKLQNGSSVEKAEVLGMATGEVAQLFGGEIGEGAKIGEIGKLGELADKTGELSKLGEITGSWVSESTNGWSNGAKAYQEQITGVSAGNAFEVNGVKFDGVNNGTLLEAKSSYDGFVGKDGKFQSWFKGRDALVDQAERQVAAANGAPIEWNFSSQKTLDATKALFKQNDITGITLKYAPAK